MTRIAPLAVTSWSAAPSSGSAIAAVDAVEILERGDVLFLPHLPFDIDPDEAMLVSPDILSPARAASTTVPARALGPSSATSAVRLPGPRELLSTTS